jgi:hypothetical protein
MTKKSAVGTFVGTPSLDRLVFACMPKLNEMKKSCRYNDIQVDMRWYKRFSKSCKTFIHRLDSDRRLFPFQSLTDNFKWGKLLPVSEGLMPPIKGIDYQQALTTQAQLDRHPPHPHAEK